jgi:hypothetical protein
MTFHSFRSKRFSDLLYYSLFLKRAYLICMVSFTCLNNSFGQANIQISQPKLKYADNRLFIQYEILGVNPDDRFNVQLEITDTTGKEIKAHSLYGDFGKNISGTSPKMIIWDMEADSIHVNIGLAIEIFVTKISPPKPLLAVKQDSTLLSVKKDSAIIAARENETIDIAKNTSPPSTRIDSATQINTSRLEESINKKEESHISYNKSAKIGSNLLLSTLVPGWGLTRLSERKPYWLLGVVAYGCIGSSIYLNSLSVSNYDKYLASPDEKEWTGYFDTGHKQYVASNALAWSAAVIWVADFGITWIKAVKIKHRSEEGKMMSFSVMPFLSPAGNTPVVSLICSF